MLQQLFAIIVIIFFISRIGWQYKNDKISKAEFSFWLIFWLFGLVTIVLIKQIDQLVASFGFSSSGIQVVLDLAVVTLFYFIFRLRLRIAKLEKDITKIVEEVALKNVK